MQNQGAYAPARPIDSIQIAAHLTVNSSLANISAVAIFPPRLRGPPGGVAPDPSSLTRSRITHDSDLVPARLSPRPGPGRPARRRPWRGEWAVAPRLSKAQELVYRGAFTEEAAGGSVQFSRAFRIESRVFVLDTPPRGRRRCLPYHPQEAGNAVRRPGRGRAGAGPSRFGWNWPASIRRASSPPSPGDVVHRAAGRAAHRGMRRLRGRAGRQGRRRFDLGNRGRGAADPRLARRRPRHGRRRPLSETGGRAKVRRLGQAAGRPHRLARAPTRSGWRRASASPPACERVIDAANRATTIRPTRACCTTSWKSRCSTPAASYEERQREIVQAHAFAEAAAPLLDTPARYGPQLVRPAQPDRLSPRSPAANALPRGHLAGQAPRRGRPARRDAAGRRPPKTSRTPSSWPPSARRRPISSRPTSQPPIRSACARRGASRCCSFSTTRLRRPRRTCSATPNA